MTYNINKLLWLTLLIHWLDDRRFGYANEKALSDGLTGTDCRGEEHDVTIVWSITSGKRQISMDGREIHYSTNRASILDFSWSTQGNHIIKVICHAAPPLQATPGFRQYDLLIDGQSFFNMPKMFQLGVRGLVGNIPNHIPGGYGNPVSPVSMGSSLNRDYPISRDQEDADLRRAIEASIHESRTHLASRSPDDRSAYTTPHPAPVVETSVDLLDLGGDGPPPLQESPSVASMPSYYSAPPTYGQNTPTATSGALVPALAPPGYYQGAPPGPQQTYAAPPPYTSPTQAYGSTPTPTSYRSPPPVPPAPAPTPAQPYGTGPMQNGDLFGLHSHVVEDPFVPKPPPPPTHQDLTSAILASYQSPLAPSTPMAGSMPNGYPYSPDDAPSSMTNGTISSPPAQSMNTLAITVTEDEPQSEFEKALKNLVNVDHIDEPAEGELKLTMLKKEEAKKVPKGRSVPKPPVGKGLVGENAPLSQIKQNYESPPKQTSEGIMNVPPPGAFDPNAGALVVMGQGPPPLHQVSGFGVGRLLPNGGFQNQQKLQPGYYMQHQQSQPQYR
jgi:hypothetical protein